jgi:homoserine kinase
MGLARCIRCHVTIKQIEVYAPASIANLGPGFDVFGMALDGLGDSLVLEETPEKGIKIEVKGLEADSIPVEAESNSAGAVLQYILRDRKVDHGHKITITKGVPPGKGMGSSGASASAAAHAACRLLDVELSQRDYVELAAIGEGVVSGSPHADNVSASLLGGFVIVGPDYDVVQLDPPDVEIVVITPEVYYKNKTRLARSLLPEKVALKDAVHNIGNASRMVAAVNLNDPELFGRCISDRLIEPYRAEMIPEFWKVKQAALEAGAYGASISGGGPSLLAVGPNTEEIGKAMRDAFKAADVNSEIILTKPSRLGAREVES